MGGINVENFFTGSTSKEIFHVNPSSLVVTIVNNVVNDLAMIT